MRSTGHRNCFELAEPIYQQLQTMVAGLPGAEHLVLRGLSDTLRNGKIGVIQFE